MEFRIADTFTDSLGRLTGEEQKTVKTTAFDLQLNPANPGMQFHRLDKARDKNFWSVRAGSDIRLIVHRTANSLLLCYVDHHDKAYAWAERRKLETHPTTGAAQLVEIRETVKEVFIPTYIPQPVAVAGGASMVREKAPIFTMTSDAELLGYGVPPEWLDDVRDATEDSILELAGHLPAEAGGRSRTLRVNYRTSHQIRIQADRLLGPNTVDVDGIEDNRNDTISVFNGPYPSIQAFASHGDESAAVGKWLAEKIAEGVVPNELAVFVRSAAQRDRAIAAVEVAGLQPHVLDEQVSTLPGRVSVSTMHLAKGLEFRAVAVMACDDEVIPSQERVEAVGDDADLKEVYDTERHLLYVACTRARDYLHVSGVEPASEFLDDLQPLAVRP